MSIIIVFHLQRSVSHPKIRPADRLFCVCLRKVWKEWKLSCLDDCLARNHSRLAKEAFQTLLVPIIPAQESGRPGTNADIRKLVKTMVEANVGWGAPRIHGELLKLGIEVSERPVSRLIPKRSTAPSQT